MALQPTAAHRVHKEFWKAVDVVTFAQEELRQAANATTTGQGLASKGITVKLEVPAYAASTPTKAEDGAETPMQPLRVSFDGEEGMLFSSPEGKASTLQLWTE